MNARQGSAYLSMVMLLLAHRVNAQNCAAQCVRFLGTGDDPVSASQYDNCMNSCNSGSSAPHFGVDKCFLQQNALRPCNSRPVGVDSHIVGTWELRLTDGPWILEIHSDGTYKFHSEAKDGAPTHEGTFAAGNGNWSLTSTTGITDSGTYQLQGTDTWIATGHLGIGAWRRVSPKGASRKP